VCAALWSASPVLPTSSPAGADAIETFLVDELPSAAPPPRGAEGLARARRFFARLGSPQDACLQVHVVGTAGKGTAVAAVASRLRGGGLSVGAHLSPHVYDIRERMLLDGQLPAWEQVGDALAEAWPVMVEAEHELGHPPSFFETTIALSWLIGRAAGVDVHVTEAGIGGALDPTNSIGRHDTIVVVMPIGWDHVDVLGPGLLDIARNKAAVIVAGSDVVVAPQPFAEAAAVVTEVASDRAARVHAVDGAGPGAWLATAERVADVVADLVEQRLGRSLPAGRAPVVLPGRLERLEAGGRHWILDGAHNPLKLRALAAALAGLDAPGPALVVAGLSREKALDDCAAELAAMGQRFVTTEFAVLAGDRVLRSSWPAGQLADAIGRHRPDAEIVAAGDIEAAVHEAQCHTEPGDTIVATGSFLLLDDIRQAALALDH
jgi:dihydrofolate synthase/folylpolyglutamate synthase